MKFAFVLEERSQNGSLLFDQVFILFGSFQIQSLQKYVTIFIVGSLCNKGCLHSGTFYFHQDFRIYLHRCYERKYNLLEIFWKV